MFVSDAFQTAKRADTRRSEGLKLWSWKGEWGTFIVREFDTASITCLTFIGVMCLACERRRISCIILLKFISENKCFTISKVAHGVNNFLFKNFLLSRILHKFVYKNF
jgi:hypothetical protein